jgi:hypothetical protein
MGDITDKDVIDGATNANLQRWARIVNENFKQTLVLVGNHDLKLINGRRNYSGRFLHNLKNVQIIEHEEIIDYHNHKIVCLPFQRFDDGKTVEEYYNKMLPEEYYGIKNALFVGHVAINEQGKKYAGIDIKKFDASNKFALGHIHTRNGYF